MPRSIQPIHSIHLDRFLCPLHFLHICNIGNTSFDKYDSVALSISIPIFGQQPRLGFDAGADPFHSHTGCICNSAFPRLCWIPMKSRTVRMKERQHFFLVVAGNILLWTKKRGFQYFYVVFCWLSVRCLCFDRQILSFDQRLWISTSTSSMACGGISGLWMVPLTGADVLTLKHQQSKSCHSCKPMGSWKSFAETTCTFPSEESSVSWLDFEEIKASISGFCSFSGKLCNFQVHAVDVDSGLPSWSSTGGDPHDCRHEHDLRQDHKSRRIWGGPGHNKHYFGKRTAHNWKMTSFFRSASCPPGVWFIRRQGVLCLVCGALAPKKAI